VSDLSDGRHPPRAGSRASVLLTGATSGIGEAAAHVLAARFGTVVLHGLQPESQVSGLLAQLRGHGTAEVHYVQADFDGLDEVLALAERVRELVPRLDVLINNAGRPGAPHRRLSRDGHEATLQTNYLAAVLLTERLLPVLGPGRIVHVASATHEMADLELDDLDLERHPYSPVGAYARSKLAMVAHALWLAEQRRAAGTQVVSISPGVVATALLHAMFRIGGASTEHGAHNVVEAATSPAVRSGQYIDDGSPAVPSAVARDPVFQARLHEVTQQLLRPWQ
jgi:NAD(P)-dependent dehydrogenase (short-subunit alcohol dehydrogenase family)